MKYQKSCNLLNPRFSLVTTNAKNANSYYQYCFPWERRRLDFRMRGRVRATCGVRLPMTAAMASRSDTHQLPAIRGMLLHPAKSRETMTAYLGSCHRLALDRRTERGRLLPDVDRSMVAHAASSTSGRVRLGSVRRLLHQNGRQSRRVTNLSIFGESNAGFYVQVDSLRP